MTNKSCEYCDGTGIVNIPNGPEDFDREVCQCDVRPELTDTVILKDGDIGKVSEFDSQGRTIHLRMRAGYPRWVNRADIAQIL